jgi:predicted RNase H-like HicB family nuclease
LFGKEMAEPVTYAVEIHRDESGAWIARVPEVPGCHTYGRSLRQAKRRIREALSLWVDDADEAELVFDVRLPSAIRRKVTASRRARETALDAQRRATEALALTALELVRKDGLSVRDAAELLGLSHQRVQQLVTAPPFQPDPELVTYLEGDPKGEAPDRFRRALRRTLG